MAQVIEQDDRGFYSLCVWNAVDKTDEEIEEAFGKYGKFANAHKSGNLLFVRYHSLETASKCCKAYNNHPVYRVAPARKKGTGNNTSSFQRRDNENRRPPADDRSNHSFSSRSSDGDFRQRSNRTSDPPPKQMPQLRPACKSPVRDPSKPKLEIAKAVMIGNLHPEIQQKDIYDLCSKTHATPLHVDIKHSKPPHYRTIYYAFVYVKTDTDVDNIIRGLNKLKLNGHTLVVNSVEKTLKEGVEAGELEIEKE